MTNNLAKRITPLCSVLILTACVSETKDDYRAQNNILPENLSQPEFVDKGGLTGKVITDKYVKGALVCFDDNKNGFCDINEASEKSYENGAFSFTKPISDKKQNSVLIAQIPVTIKSSSGVSELTQKIMLCANQVSSGQSQMITPFTTLVVNEQLYNPYINANKDEAISYLEAIKLMSKSVLEGEDYKATNNTQEIANASHLVKAYTQAFAIKESNPFSAIANVVDKIVKTKKLNINIDLLVPQKRLDQNVSLVDINKKTTWQKHYKDEVILGSGFAKDVKKIVTFSKWHNKLTILDSSDLHSAPSVQDSNKFLYVDEPRDGVDANTGASEQELTQLRISNDGSTIYSMLTKFEDGSKDIGVGVYISDISSSTVPETIFATEKNSAYFYPYKQATDIALSPDSTKFGISGNDKRIVLFDAGNLSSPTHEIQTTKKVKAITISKDNSAIFAGLYKLKKNSFGVFDVTTKSLLGEFLLEEYPTTILQKTDNEVFIASKKSNKIFHLDISDKSNIKKIAMLTASAKVKKLSFSSNGQYLIAALTAKQVNAFDLTNTLKVASMGLDDIVVDAFDIGENNIAIAYGTNVSYFNISENSQLTEAEKQAWETEHRK